MTLGWPVAGIILPVPMQRFEADMNESRREERPYTIVRQTAHSVALRCPFCHAVSEVRPWPGAHDGEEPLDLTYRPCGCGAIFADNAAAYRRRPRPDPA